MRNLFKKPKPSIFKILTTAFSVILVVFTIAYYINYKYLLIIDDFYSKFSSCNFSEAKNIITNDNIYFKLKKNTLHKDLDNYFSSIVKNLCDDVLNNEDDKSKALIVLNEIKDYNILNSSLNKLIISLDENYTPETEEDYQALLELGLDNCNNGNFNASINLLKQIPNTSEIYDTSNEYISKCIDDYKENLFASADALVKDDYYSKAIELLSNIDNSIINTDDSDIVTKINSISEARDNYLASIGSDNSENLVSTSTELLQSITSNTINTLNIESLTSYLIYVNLSDQLTYIYNGSVNNWNIIKSFKCSTGIDEEKTPTGVFDVRERGDWFYSDKYEQGGKYWVQFYGDYLFHSVPYNEDQSEVIDNTLGTPASHGCIRLKTEDAKWIYDNIESGTKVIIN